MSNTDDYAAPLATYLKLTGQQDGEGNLLTSNPETSGRYHSAWLSMMYPRLFLARQLLREDGVIFVSIDDHEVHNLQLLMNEVFGEENRIECFIWKKSYGGGAKERHAVTQHEYLLLYAKNMESVDELWLPPDPETEQRYYKYRDNEFEQRGPYRLQPLEAAKSMDARENLVFGIPLPWGGEVRPKRQWWWSRERALRALANDELVFTRNRDTVTVSYKQYLRDERGQQRGAKPFSVIEGIYTQHGTEDLNQLFGNSQVMQFPKPVALLKKLLSMATQPAQEDIVLDFFAGSCTTAQAVIDLNRDDGGNRRFVTIQLPEPLARPLALNGATALQTVADIGKERIRRVIAKMKSERAGQLPLDDRATPEDLGFKVFKLAPSNFRPWQEASADPDAYAAQLALFANPLVECWTVQNVVYEVAIKEGYDLNCRVEAIPAVQGIAAYRVSDPSLGQSFYICLDGAIHLAALAPLGLSRDDLFICRDSALDDETAANLALQCRLKTI